MSNHKFNKMCFVKQHVPAVKISENIRNKINIKALHLAVLKLSQRQGFTSFVRTLTSKTYLKQTMARN